MATIDELRNAHALAAEGLKESFRMSEEHIAMAQETLFLTGGDAVKNGTITWDENCDGEGQLTLRMVGGATMYTPWAEPITAGSDSHEIANQFHGGKWGTVLHADRTVRVFEPEPIYIPKPKTTQPTADNRHPLTTSDEIRAELRGVISGGVQCDVSPAEPETCNSGGSPEVITWDEIGVVELELVDGFADDVPSRVEFELAGIDMKTGMDVAAVVTCTLSTYGRRTRDVVDGQKITTLVAQYEVEVS